MASAVSSGSNMPAINKTFSNVKEKMVEIAKQIREADEQTKAAKMAAKEHYARERIAVQKQHGIRDRMNQMDGKVDKVEIKIQNAKERLFVAARRYEENVKMCQSLEDNKIDISSSGYDDKTKMAKERLRTMAEEAAENKRKADELKFKIEQAERRELKAKIKKDHFEEIQRSREQTKCVESTNYEPKSDQEYIEEISILRARLTEAVRRFQAKEAKMAVLEKKETEIEANIQYTKKKILSTKQAQHEMSGTKM